MVDLAVSLKKFHTDFLIFLAVCDQVNYKRKLLEDWGLKRFYAYGTCVSVLMQGMSGTSK